MTQKKLIEITEPVFDKMVECGKAIDCKAADVVLAMAIEALAEKINTRKAVEANKKFIEQCEDWMFHPSAFEESNAVFGPPEGMTEDEVYSLCGATIVWGGMPAILTCWKPTMDQLDHLKETGRVWIATMGSRAVPMCVCAKKPLDYPGIDLI